MYASVVYARVILCVMLLISLRYTGDTLPRALVHQRFNPHPSVGAGAIVVYPIVDSDVKWLLPVHSVERFVRNASAFPVNTGSVCSELFADYAAVYTAPTSLALKVRIRLTGAIVVVVALLRMSLAVDAPSYGHWCFALLESGEFHTPRCTGGRTTPQWQAAPVYPIVNTDVKWSTDFTRRGVGNSPPHGGETYGGKPLQYTPSLKAMSSASTGLLWNRFPAALRA